MLISLNELGNQLFQRGFGAGDSRVSCWHSSPVPSSNGAYGGLWADLGMPHTRSLGQGLFELRMKSNEGIGRVMFCLRPGREIRCFMPLSRNPTRRPRRK
ncbi:MAG: type II toxin-antitoxin system RelE/ParE family toxin [Gemmataceae bacterium]